MNLTDKFIHTNNVTHRLKLPMTLTVAMLIAIATLFSSCNGSKAYFKRGAKLEEQGMVEEAAAAYYGSLQRNRNNTDAKIGLRATGQQVLNKKLDDFIRSKNLEQKKEAVYGFIKVKEYQEKIKRIGVSLEIPDMYKSDYESITQSYLADLYNEGIDYLDQGDFSSAEVRFKEIGKFDSNYKDANNLADIAFLEPMYSGALEHMEAGKFRSAYNDFDLVIQRDATFKDAQELKTECQEAGLITLALLPFTNSTYEKGLEKKVSAYTLDALTQINDPFLTVVDRENFDNIIDEQQLGMSGVVDGETAVNAGNLIGAKTILTGTVLSYNTVEGRLQKTSLQGYESYREKKLNKETNKHYYETKYRAKTYYKYQKKNIVEVSFQYKVTSAETGEVISSKIIEDKMEDVMVYAEYGGDKSKLYPSGSNGVNTSGSAKRELDRLLNGSKVIKSTSELSNDIMKDVSYKLSSNIQNLMYNEVK